MNSNPSDTPGNATRVLLLVSNPFDASLNIADDLAELEDALRGLAAPADFVIIPAEADAVSGLLAQRNRAAFQVLHYLGHGYKLPQAQQGYLVLEDKTGGARLLEPARLFAMLNPTGQQNFQVAVLSACHSESVAAAFAALGVKHIIAINAEESIYEIAAVQFCRRFYQALLTGATVAEAFNAGRNAVLTDDRFTPLAAAIEAAKFKLLPAGADHDQPLTDGAPVGAAGGVQVQGLPRLSQPPFHQRPREFVGRNDDLHDLIRLLDQRHCALIRGVSGVGKTELAREAAHWLVAHGQAGPERTGFVALGNLTQTHDVRSAIVSALRIATSGWPLDDPGANAALAAAIEPGTLLIADEAENFIRAAGRAGRDLFEALTGAAGQPLLLVTSQRDVGSARLPVYDLRQLSATAALQVFFSAAQITPAERTRLTEDDLLKLLGYVDRLPRAVELVAKQWRHIHSPDLGPLLAELARYKDEVMHDPYYPEEVKSVTVGIRLAYERLLARDAEAGQLFTMMSLFRGGLPEAGVAEIFGQDAGCRMALIEDESLAERPFPDLLYLPVPFQHFAKRHLRDSSDATRNRLGERALGCVCKS